MKYLKSSITFFLVGLLLIVSTYTVKASEPPPEIVSALIIKLMPFEQTLMSGNGDMTIHVIGSTALADALQKVVGWQIGSRKLGTVTVSDNLPSEKPDVLCITDEKILIEAIEYSRKEKILSMTNDLELVKKGVSLGIGVNEKGKPSISLSLESSKKENLNWNSAVLKIAKTIK